MGIDNIVETLRPLSVAAPFGRCNPLNLQTPRVARNLI